ncbi:PhoH family protein [Calycomorphotria hydatis]|uniref:PhoH-like protein n=1 Tax=Calycomorphotria hydatis TaxID=2528027 RepID=A0A517T3U3_9PLAN|nr:PhoH family protein [Calycomorphotria hydatis]QDT63044.1 PhoH-like protein [Calycomorphotria hydatis]
MIETVTGVNVRKTFVLDTNVILHDSQCIRNFAEHDVAIPITVLEELDRFKKGSEDIHFHARQFLRAIDELTGDLLSPQGASLGEDLGNIRVVIGGEFKQELAAAFVGDSPDHRILNTALSIKKHESEHARMTILVTKDTNLRMKAKSFGLISQDYENDKVESFDALYMGKRMVQDLPHDLIGRFYQDETRYRIAKHELYDLRPELDAPVANENFILRNGSTSALATYNREEDLFKRAEKISAYGITPRNAEQIFALNALLDDNIQLVTLAGKAGSGKTLIALAGALESRSRYRQILLARPVVPLSNRDLGYLPGDVNDKLDPYMQPLYDNMNVIRHAVGEDSEDGKRINLMKETGKIEISPLAYIRGRSLSRIFFIVDEAQNLTPHEVKTIITRAGEGTKIIFTGDIHQIDHPYLDSLSNGLSYLINRMKDQPLYAHVTLEKGERSELAELASDLL